MLNIGTYDEQEGAFVGGMRYVRWDGLRANYTAPFARLWMTDTGIRIGPVSKLAVGMETFDIPYEYIETVQRVRGILLSNGVRITDQRHKDEPIIFWTMGLRQVEDAFEQRGIPVDKKARWVV